MRVRKYNKKLVDFDKNKIINSIKMASKNTENETIPDFMTIRIADKIEDSLNKTNTKIITTENLSNLVENALMQTSYKEVAKNYITYHFEREKEHVYNSELIKAFEKKLNGSNIENSNANCDERSFSGRMNEAARVLLKDNALKTMSKKFRDNHVNNEVYTHDLDSYSSGQHNCFDRNTKFITKNGVRSFNDFNDGDTVVVLDKNGNWQNAIVHSYGYQTLQLVTFTFYDKNNNMMDSLQYKCTKNHRWILKNNEVTTYLKVNDELLSPINVNKYARDGYWKVASIKPLNDNELVWCVEEPVTHSFTLYGGIVTGNCLSIPFDPMFKNGVHIKQTDIRSPKSIGTAMQQLAVYIQVQSLQQFGGVSATHLDWTMVPYVRWSFFKHLRDGKKYLYKEDWKIPANCYLLSIDDYKNDPCYQYALDMTVRETLQGAEALIHNLNSLQSRSGQQLPFSSINYGTCPLTEGRMIINAILDATLDGTGPLHKTPIFPCGIFQVDKKINCYPGTPNYDLFRKALYCTSKRFYPNYCNCDWSVNTEGIEKDVKHKTACLSKLSKDKMDILVKWVKENESEAKLYKMVIKDDKVVIDSNLINPVEIMSTMGKCKLQLM